MKKANKDLMADIRNGIIVAIVFFIAFLLFVFIVSANPRFAVFINHGIYLPKPETMTSVYNYAFRKGEDLDIWEYSEKNFNKVISKKYFYQINDNNIEDINEKVVNYYKELDGSEKKLFDKNIDINKIINANNYYFLKETTEDSQTFLIIIADSSNRKLYFFNMVD